MAAPAAALAPPASVPAAAGRLHGMDNVRALAMLGGVAFHAALAYSPLAHPFFPTADRAGSAAVDAVAWYVHLVRMPVFFAVAGYFAALVVRRRGMGGLFRDRLRRVALPFVLFLPPLTAAMTASTRHAAATARHPSPVLQLVAEFGRMADPPRLPPGTSHLWFLYYLLWFYVLAWVASTYDLGRVAARVRSLSPGWLLGLGPLLLAPAFASVSAPHPAPESFLPQFWALGLFGAWFAFGWLAHGHEAIIDRLRPRAPWLVLGSLLAYAAFLRLLERGPLAATAPWPVALAEAGVCVWGTAACLVAARTTLDRPSPLLRRLADASYWVYLVHLPLLLVVQYRLMDLDRPWWQKLVVAVGATMAAGFASYELLVRRTPLRHLVGVRARGVAAAA